MYKVIIVDDEKIIIESISSLIDWDKYGLALAGSAQNGIEAYNLILKEKPDIVLTDIKMPGMNGLELIEKVKNELPDTVFIILSGYSEFDFASKAIQYGVKHYLLKPCDEEEIVPVLIKIINELNRIHSKEKFIQEINHSIHKVLPQVREQFLRDFAIGGIYREKDLEFFLKLFNIEDDRFKMILFRISNGGDFIERFALRNISEEIIGSKVVYLDTIIEKEILFLIKPIEDNILIERLEEIRDAFSTYYKLDISAAVSREDSFSAIPSMFSEVKDSLKYAFYLGEGSIITKYDADFIKEKGNDTLKFDFENKIGAYVKAGDIENLKQELKDFFDRIDVEKLDIGLTKSYSMELYLTIARQCPPDLLNEYVKGVVNIQDMYTLKQIQEYIETVANEITNINYDYSVKKYSRIIDSVIKHINANIQNPDLSLSWVANKIVYMNENYLGKLFIKEIGEKFTQYVIRICMERAMELFDSPNDYKVYEVTEMVGFADNSQYFSQVFKKVAGMSPSEYKKSIESKQN